MRLLSLRQELNFHIFGVQMCEINIILTGFSLNRYKTLFKQFKMEQKNQTKQICISKYSFKVVKYSQELVQNLQSISNIQLTLAGVPQCLRKRGE
jgi:hypothetical protein